MFRISRRTDYAVRVMLTLAKRPAQARVSTRAVHDETLVPLAFLQRIVATLRRAGLLHAHAGAHGGLQLARPSAEISLLDVHLAVEEPIVLSECLPTPCSCPLAGPCPVRPRWGKLDALIHAELRATTLGDLVAASPARRKPMTKEIPRLRRGAKP